MRRSIIKFYIYIITLQGHFNITGNLDDETKLLDSLLEDLLFCFKKNIDVKNKKIELPSLQKKDQDILNNIYNYIERYGKNLRYNSKKLSTFFECMEDNELFYVVPINRELSEDEISSIVNELENMLPQDKKDQRHQIKSVINNLSGIYQMVGIDTKNMSKYIGEPVKDKRICRFCKRQSPTATFKSTAHAISRALGNYNIKLNEECDDCNNYFSELESQFNDYLKIYKLQEAVFDIGDKINFEQKIGDSKFDKFCFNIKPPVNDNSSFFIEIQATDRFLDHNFDPPQIKFPVTSVVPQNIYKTLCKYALSCIEQEHLGNFLDTTRWVRGISDPIHSLPLVGITSKGIYREKPGLMIWIRKDDNKKYLKSVVIFTISKISFLYTLPSDEEAKEEQFNDFLDLSEVFTKVKWDWQDFSNAKNVEMSINLKFQQNNRLNI